MSTIPKLIGALTIDAIGMGLSIIPVLGAISDIVWAPITALYIKLAFNDNMFAMIGFIEEITFFDIIPSATIAWFRSKYAK